MIPFFFFIEMKNIMKTKKILVKNFQQKKIEIKTKTRRINEN